MSVTESALNDLRRRILDHEAKVATGEASPEEPPYTIDELKEALAAISVERSAVVPPKRKKSTSKAVDLTDLL